MSAADETLVLGTLRGDRSAFAELYDRHARLIRAVGYDATGDLHAAADLTQEVFLRAYRNLGELRDPQRFAAWLVGIARQVCREWRRARSRDRRLLTGLSDRAAAETRLDRPDQQIAALREALAALPERERLALHAFYLQEMNVEQARAVLGLSKSGLYRVLSCARRRLARVLRQRETMPWPVPARTNGRC
ncbi:MAG: sigma-70 family RNA polymerase sigma factor [Phycisphaerales bacterium]|nr:MAG: sigma-70 family RNA polymerase sigma factor [Phycisphaerales bacterium]